MSEHTAACCNQKTPACGCGHSHGDKADHRHAQVSLWAAGLGAILIINGFLAKSLYDDEFVSTLSSVAGAFVLALPILWSALQDLVKGRIHMDVMVALGLLAAIMKQQFQESGIIAFFMIIAIALEERTAHGAQKSIEEIISLTPNTARLLGDDDSETQVQAGDLKVGDVVRVRPGENFPADGVVLKGQSTVNQASITGESLPVDKDVSNDVYAGTENLTGAIDLRVTGVGEDTTLGKVRDLIQNAESSKLPILRIIDRYLVYYAPTVVMLALMVWFFTGDIMRFVYVLVISCPCALVLATPSAVVAAIASSARLGMLIKDVSHIETAAGIKAVIFDKTGTLTEGQLEVAKLNPAEGVELADLLTDAVTAESQSNHPAARAMRRLAKEADISWKTPDTFEEVPGRGVIAKIDGATIRIGRASWLTEEGLDVSVVATDKDDDASHGKSVVFVSRDDTVLGWIAMSDGIRKSAKDAIMELDKLGIRSHMVTGDNESVATVVAGKLGIKHLQAECLPQDKVDYVERLRQGGNHIAVVGDGINDAPALAAGDVSVAMGAIGSDVAINSASVALMNDDLRRVPYLIKLSRKTRAIINLNLAFGCLMIVGGIMLFIFGDNFLNNVAGNVFGSENPSILKSFVAAGLHTVGTLLVVFNSARLVRFGEDLDQRS